MRILVVGGGGREHSFCWKLAQSSKLTQLFAAPGNAGTAEIATNLPIGVTDFATLKEAVLGHQIQMVVVGPEAPLVEGIADYFSADPQLQNVPVIGPQKAAARLEGSKSFAKKFMQKHQIPTAAYGEFTADSLADGEAFLESMQSPYVLKADGLAAGKGVLIIQDLNEAKSALRKMLLEQQFGEASQTVVIEEFLQGIEASCFVWTDGKSYKILPYAKDYKRIGEGDTGLNTGGMGAISPVPFLSEALRQTIEEQIVVPTIDGLQKDNMPYVGFVFIGLMIVGDKPYVIEYNVRMGDPETEVVLPRIQSDLVDIFQAMANGTLADQPLQIDPQVATTVMAVSKGYPEAYPKGKTITGLSQASQATVFHAGTQVEQDKIITAGGRVLAATGMGETMEKALEKSYTALSQISFEGINYRKDIGFDL
ncbi:MAG: phosphoribosylamine--glycine ligase [Flavobacteriaceae bacterium]